MNVALISGSRIVVLLAPPGAACVSTAGGAPPLVPADSAMVGGVLSAPLMTMAYPYVCPNECLPDRQ